MFERTLLRNFPCIGVAKMIGVARYGPAISVIQSLFFSSALDCSKCCMPPAEATPLTFQVSGGLVTSYKSQPIAAHKAFGCWHVLGVAQATAALPWLQP